MGAYRVGAGARAGRAAGQEAVYEAFGPLVGWRLLA